MLNIAQKLLDRNSSRTMPSKTRSYNRVIALLVISAALPVAESFGIAGDSLRGKHSLIKSLPKVPQLAHSSPLFVANAQDAETIDSPFVKNLDAEMKKAQKKREIYQKKLSTFESRLEQLEQKKQEYLQGTKLGEINNNFTETTLRSAVKAMMWRVIAGSVTFITSLKVSGSMAVALKIVGSDFFSKAFTMFLGERIMNKSQAGRKTGADSTGRSVAKALIWRLFAICNTLTVSFFFAGNLKMAGKIAGSDAIFKTALMVFYERVWAKIEWGKEYSVEFSI
mmetsp:Transcript_855/g.912  ORF Transcript_855/g.912 Transcript_855/m.912 type:complete len:281 (+) Transcript_855:70-912(+)